MNIIQKYLIGSSLVLAVVVYFFGLTFLGFDADKIDTVALSQDESKAYFSLPECDNLELKPVFSFDKGYYLSVVNYIKRGLPKATIIE